MLDMTESVAVDEVLRNNMHGQSSQPDKEEINDVNKTKISIIEEGNMTKGGHSADEVKRKRNIRTMEHGKRTNGRENHGIKKQDLHLKIPVKEKIVPDNHISKANINDQCDVILMNITGTFLGFIRIGYFISAFLVLTSHIAFPPLLMTSSTLDTNWVKLVAGTLGYMRLFFEILASLVVIGDAVVTWSTLNGALASSATFMAQFALPHWLTRTILVLVVCSSYSSSAEVYVSKTWSPSLAYVYTILPLISFVSGALVVGLWRLPGFGDHAWLAYKYKDLPEEEDCVDNWTPLLQVDQSKRQWQNHSTRVLKALCLVPGFLALVLNIVPFFSWTQISEPSLGRPNPDDNTDSPLSPAVFTLTPWRETFRICLQIILCVVLLGFNIYQIRKRHKDRMPSVIKLGLLYVVINALAGVHLVTSHIWLILCLYFLGSAAIIVPMFAFSVMRPVRESKQLASERVTWMTEFLKNFAHLGKWMRIGEVAAVVLALAGLMFATLSLPLPWFRIEFEMDDKLEGFVNTVRECNKTLTEAVEELEDFGKKVKAEFKDLSCDELAGALAGAAVLSLLPGAGQALKQGMRVAKYMRSLGQKLLRYKSVFYRMIALFRKTDGLAHVAKRPLLVGITLENMGMLMFLMPVIITGTIVIFFAFWPRKLRSGNWLQGKKKCCVVLGTASIHLAFNVAGLMLFEWWGPMIAAIADGLPLTKARLVKESGWKFVEAGYGCTVAASFIFFLQAFFSIFRPEPEISTAVMATTPKTPPSLRKLKESKNQYGSTPTLYRKKTDTTSATKLSKMSASCSKLDQCSSSNEFNAKIRWKMFRATMMDTAPPRAWCLSLIFSFIVLWLSIEAVLQKWMTFDPVLKPKWAKLFGELDSQSNSTDIIREELDESSSDCLFDRLPDLRQYIKTIISPEIKEQWRDLVEQLNLPEFNLQIIDPSFLIDISGLFLSIVFTIPNFVCCVLVVAGFVTSFSVRASYYFSTQEVLSWISKIALFCLFGILNTLIFVTKIFSDDNLPIYDLQVQFKPGFVYAVISTILVLTIWILLMVEVMAPPAYVSRKQKAPSQPIAGKATIREGHVRKRHKSS